MTLEDPVDNDAETNSGPTLKRLRLRGDWSDTGPQALPESEMRNQAGGRLDFDLKKKKRVVMQLFLELHFY